MTDHTLQVTDVDCPACGALVGDWCRRHGETQTGATLCCAPRLVAVERLNRARHLPYNSTAGYVDRQASVDRALAEAANSVASARQQAIFETVARAGAGGLTWRQVQHEHPRLHHGQISGALSCLHLNGVVFAVVERRDRCHPYVAAAYRHMYLDYEVVDRPAKSASTRRRDAIERAADLLEQAACYPDCPREVALALQALRDI